MKNKKSRVYKIGVDARPLSTGISGVGRVIAETIRFFPEKESFEFYLFTHRTIHQSHISLLELKNVKVIQSTGIFAWKGGIYFNLYLPLLVRKIGLDLFWGSQQVICPFLPKALPVVLTFYDLVSYFFPNTMRKIAAIQQRLFQKLSVKRANFIISISKQTNDDMIQLFHFDKDKTRVAYPGIDPNSIKYFQSFPVSKRILNIPSSYFLTVSTIEPRKNYPFLLKVYEEYSKQYKGKNKLSWVIAGKIGWESEDFLVQFQERLQSDSSLIFIESPDDHELQHLYHRASLFLFASLYEGFGIPLVEALLHKKFSIVSDIPTFREIGGKEILYLPLTDPSLWAKKIIQYQNKPNRVKFDPKKFSWKRSSEITKEVFDRVLSR
ncbi:MAG: glycosyltransferase family 4 protein [Leptospiraceae bacterium]|nr:glycosyltransferase family 4 protein [Leptospiraceae bacterium]MCK6381729.1 glycosyltransferase family 4 protein [Leptospiraceae bacterium]NUM42363.1 glycosyltransferase family 4 protein [Leptospiraceae bacterium]